MKLQFTRAVPIEAYHGFGVTFWFLEKDEQSAENTKYSYYEAAVGPGKYMGSSWIIGGGGTYEQDMKWARCLFYALKNFLVEYYKVHKVLPTSNIDGNAFIDGEGYINAVNRHIKSIYFTVNDENQLEWKDAEIVLQ